MANLPQSGITARVPEFARHISLTLNERFDDEQLRKAMVQVPKLTQAFAKEFPDTGIASTIALSPNAWSALYDESCPELIPFPAIALKKETVVPTDVDFFLQVCSDRFDLTLELTQSILQWFRHNTELQEEIICYRYFYGRDLTGFSGHTSQEMSQQEKNKYAVIHEPNGIEDGGSYVNIQRFTFDMPRWQNLPESVQEEVMGKDKRTGHDIEPDEEDMSHIHRVRCAGNNRIVRAGMPYGDSREQGHSMISYANKPDAFIRILDTMIQKDAFGHSDPLLRYAKPVTGASLFAPSIDFLFEHNL